MSEEKITEYVTKFIGTKPVKSSLKNVVLYIGQRCENEDIQSVDKSLIMESRTTTDLLVGARILEEPTNKTFKLTEKRGKEIYELIKKETKEETETKESAFVHHA